MLTEETLKILVPLFTAMLGIAIGYFLKKVEYERKRRDELADRDFDRRAAIHDRRIQEARDALEKWTSFIYFSAEVTKIIKQEKSLKGIVHSFESYDEEFRSIPSMRHETKTKESIIDMLNDKELSDLNTELSQHLQFSMQNLTILEDNLNSIDENLKLGIEKLDVKEISDITKNVDLDESGEALREADKIIIKMKIRLDELAQTVK